MQKSLQTKRALRTALLVLLLSVVGMGKMYAQEFTVGDLNYSVNDDGVSVTVTGHVDGTSAMGALIIPASVANNGHSYNVTEVGDDAFRNCSGITSVSLPNTLTTIGRRVFHSCSGLTSVTLPSQLTFVGMGAFTGTNIIYTNYTGTLERWCAIYFEGITSNPVSKSRNLFINGIELTDAVIPESTSHIKDYVFWNCESITSLYIPETVLSISYYAFCGCSKLQQIIVVEDNPNYDSRNNCNALIESTTNILFVGSNNTIIPNTVEAIGANAFCLCDGLESVDIPASIDSINWSAFSSCSGLKQITVDPDNPTFNSQNNCNAIIETATNTLIVGCMNSTIPESVETIGRAAFSGRTGLQHIFIPQSVCSIETQAFSGCSGLNSIITYAETPPVLTDDYVFYGVPCTTLIVPCNCASAYETSDWHNHFTTIEEDCEPHNINIDEGGLSGGNVNTSVNSTNMGEEVQFTITPNDGMELVSVAVFNANNSEQMVSVYPIGKANLTFGFIMPPFDVVIKAEFHPITTVDENDATWVSIYPNPSNGQIRIEAEGIKHISISNMLGQTVYKGNAENDVLQYDFGKHEAGMYLIRIEAANGVAMKKVSVTR